MNKEQAAALRKAFDKKSIGKIPKGGTQLDYVGHAAVTDRLLSVDPEWTWEPMALSPEGLPLPDGNGNLWIKLTVCGVTRIGVGDGKSMKELIGDAIRNAAMRFGVALDLWSKEELESVHAEPPTAKKPDATPDDRVEVAGPPMNKDQQAKMFAQFDELGIKDRAEYRAYIERVVGQPVQSSKDLTVAQASAVIESQIAELSTDEAP